MKIVIKLIKCQSYYLLKNILRLSEEIIDYKLPIDGLCLSRIDGITPWKLSITWKNIKNLKTFESIRILLNAGSLPNVIKEQIK